VVRSLLVAVALFASLAASASAEATLPETQLPLRLIGTVVVGSGERSLAVIENGGRPAVVRTGDAIAGARVHEIRKDGVVLAQAGRLEQLAFAPGTSSAGSGTASGDDSEESRAGRAGTRTGDTAARRAQLQARAVRRTAFSSRSLARHTATVPASPDAQEDAASTETKETLTNEQLLLQLSKQARYAPLLDDDGKLRGVALMDIRPDSTLERIGLRNGDVVVSVAGVKVDNTSRAYDALRAINPRAGGEVVVERRGVPTRIAVAAGAL
jgi:type II secretion system protein C